ncbi:hypothetical protein AGDE_02345 [Angomonas deanei]|nr:hypothetical protein AGDE_02345 [Angomonas deanei]|eukprot:EPY41579.1 hypothetical protein AGDE_02345 [Angomonas deanei]
MAQQQPVDDCAPLFGAYGAPAPPVSVSPFKAQIAALLSSVRMLMRWPLIFANLVLIAFAIALG